MIATAPRPSRGGRRRRSSAAAGAAGAAVPAVMGVLNVTPDSFSDGGQFLAPEQRARPGRADDRRRRRHHRHRRGIHPPLWRREPVSADEECAAAAGAGRRRRARHAGLDRQHEGGGRGLGARRTARPSPTTSGACSAIPRWRAWSPTRGVPVIVMHNRDSADPAIDIMDDIAAFFARSLAIAAQGRHSAATISCSIPASASARRREQSMTALARLDELQLFGLPILVGASRKRFISTVSPSEPQQRLGGSIAAHLLAAQNGAQHHAHPRRGRNRAGAAGRRARSREQR